jgi:hypothetical protein
LLLAGAEDWVLAEIPTGLKLPVDVGVPVNEPDTSRGESFGTVARGFSGLGGVLGEVAGHGVRGELAVVIHVGFGQADDADVELIAPGDRPTLPISWMRGGGEGRCLHGVIHVRV